MYPCQSGVVMGLPFTGDGPAEKKRWLLGPLAAAPSPNARPHNPGTENRIPPLRLSGPTKWPVTGSKALISPSSTLPTRSLLLRGPKSFGASAIPHGEARIGETVVDKARLLAYSLRHFGFFRLVVRSQTSRMPADATIQTIGTNLYVTKEGKQAVAMTRLSCHRFRAYEVRLWLSVIAYNLGNLWRRLAFPAAVANWSLTSLQQRLVKTGGRLIKHARNYWLLLAESYLTRRLFGGMLSRIVTLPVPAG